ncbi:MAG: phosphodiesterase, partial [Chloroflexota bacterium]
IHTFENDTGPDDANHAEYGIYIYYDPRQRQGGQELQGLELMDVGPTMLDALGVSVPGDMRGRLISRR